MSCHEIGAGLNSVTETVNKQYLAGNMNKKAFRRLLISCRQGVHYCDGNEGEAMEALVDADICGACLEKKEDISSIYDGVIAYPDCCWIFDKYKDKTAHFYVCPACKKKIVKQYLKEYPDAKLKEAAP